MTTVVSELGAAPVLAAGVRNVAATKKLYQKETKIQSLNFE